MRQHVPFGAKRWWNLQNRAEDESSRRQYRLDTAEEEEDASLGHQHRAGAEEEEDASLRHPDCASTDDH